MQTNGHVVNMPVLNLFEVRRFIDLVYSPQLTGAMSVVSTGSWTGKQFPREDMGGLLEYVQQCDQAGKPGIYLRTTTTGFDLGDYRRGDATQAMELPGLWVDLDFGTDGHAEKKDLPHPPNAEAAASLVQISGLPDPTLWVHSGGGLYAWWLLHEPFWIPDAQARTYLTTLSRKWNGVIGKAAASRGWYYGTEASDLARVLRLPGTVNRKVVGRDRPCYILSDFGPRYLLQDLHHAVEPLVARWGVDVNNIASGGQASSFETSQFYSSLVNPDGEPCRFMGIVRDRWVNSIIQAGPSCHDEGVKGALAIAMEGANRHHGANTAMRQLQDTFLRIRVPGAASGIVVEDSSQEWERLEQGAWRRAAARAAQPGDPMLKEKDYCRCFDALSVVPNFISPGGQPTTQPTTQEFKSSTTNLPQEFWSSRPVLKHIQTAAHMRSRSADAVLGSVLARLSSILPGDLRADTGTATPASLNFYAVLLGPPGSGKSSSAGLAESLFPMGYDSTSRAWPIGSGQGMAAAYGGIDDGEFKQTETQAFFTCDEGSSLIKLSRERGNSTMDTLRAAWTGGQIGQKNAAAERDRRISNYALGFRLCLQPIHAIQLLSDENVGDGTFQRFVWFSTVDPNIPDNDDFIPAMPDPMPFDLAAAYARDPIIIPDNIKRECRRRDRAGSRGDVELDATQEHALLRQVKLACLLSILDSRRFVTDEDWALAQTVLNVSDAVAESVRADAHKRMAKKAEARTQVRIREKVQELEALDQREEEKVERYVLRVIERVRERPGLARGALRCALTKDKDLGDLAIDRAIDRHMIRAETVKQGEQLWPV
jgi:hypothetical protein